MGGVCCTKRSCRSKVNIKQVKSQYKAGQKSVSPTCGPRFSTAKFVQQKKDCAMEQGQGKPAAEKRNVQVTTWPDSHSRLPNSLALSNLFEVGKSSASSQQVEGRSLYTLDGLKVLYTGRALNQHDENVLRAVMQLLRGQNTNKLEASSYSLLKEMGKQISTSNYQQLEESLVRMQGNSIKIEQHKKNGQRTVVRCSIFNTVSRRSENPDGAPVSTRNDAWVIEVNEALIRLYEQTRFATDVDWAQRKRLPVGIATWLHTHLHVCGIKEKGLVLELPSLQRLCGSVSEMRTFRSSLRKACEQIKEVGLISTYSVELDILRVSQNALPERKTASMDLFELLPSEGLTMD
jgi:hypothetical protein